MSNAKPVTMLVSYHPKEGKEEELLALIKNHWPTLNRMGLVTKMAPQVWRAVDKRSHRTYFVEMFQWKDDKASDIAHQSPEVMSIWEPMGPILENLQLTQIEPISPPVANT
jgi:quinol monooxygenase YgiN